MSKPPVLEARQLVIYDVPGDTATPPLMHAGRHQFWIVQCSDTDGNKTELHLRRRRAIVPPENMGTAFRTEIACEMLA